MPNPVSYNFNLHAITIPKLTEGMRVVEGPAFSYSDSRIASDTFNILHVHNGALLLEEDLKVALHYFNEQRLPCCVWVNEDQFSQNVKAIFKNLDLKKTNTEPAMALELSRFNKPEPIHTGNIQSVRNESQVQDFAAVLSGLADPPDQNVKSYYAKTAQQFIKGVNNIQLYVYYLEGSPVGTVEVFPSDKHTIGLYGLATRHDMRGRGIGTAMMTSVLNSAKKNQYSQAILQASEDGIGLYQKLGFEIVNNYYEFHYE